MIDYTKMNEAQRLAVTHGEGPLLLLAGPGSGKTFTITQRILYLLDGGTVPERILVITFTKDAAASMQQRFCKLSHVSLPVNFGTFHSVFYHMLKESGVIRTEHPLNQSQKKKILLPILKEYSGEAFKELLQEDTAAILNAMSFYKNTMSMEAAAEKAPKEWREAFPAVMERYEAARRKLGAVDFDDMVCECRNMLSRQPRNRQYWQNRFDHILMDEFQDINPVQYETVKLLAKPPYNFFAVGDDDQAIYGFRGAQPECLKKFKEDFNARQLLLNINYRSCAEIIDAAGKVIGENRNRFHKELKPVSYHRSQEEQSSPEYNKNMELDNHFEHSRNAGSDNYSEHSRNAGPDNYFEYSRSAEPDNYSEHSRNAELHNCTGQNRSAEPESFSGLEQQWRHSNLHGHKIYMPCNIFSRTSLELKYEMLPEVHKSPVAIWAFADRESQYEYLLQRLKGSSLGCAVLFRTNAMMQSVAARLRQAEVPYIMKEKVQSIYEHFIIRDILAYLLLAQGKWSKERFLDICNRPSRYISREAVANGNSLQQLKVYYAYSAKQLSALELLERQLEYLRGVSLKTAIAYICKVIGYERYLKEQSKRHPGKWLEWQEMLEWVKTDSGRYEKVEDWMAAQEEYNESLKLQEKRENMPLPKEAVWLMTVHASKGLEFDHVIIPDCNEKVFPHGKMLEETVCEEERRIFYVAMTRAAKSLELLYLDDTGSRPPSRFLNPLFGNT